MSRLWDGIADQPVRDVVVAYFGLQALLDAFVVFAHEAEFLHDVGGGAVG
jgi:hypothetical protein